MIKHFFERLLIVIITLVVVSLFGYIFVKSVLGYDFLNRLYLIIYFIFFVVVAGILGLVLDSIILYRKQERDKTKAKAKASLLVLFVFLLILYFFLSYFWLFVFLFIDGNEYLK